MSAYHEQGWAKREATLGDEAESIFEQVQTKGFARHGLRRPPIQVHTLPPLVRYTPDYLRSGEAVEVMGCGKDQKLKLKVEKHHALHMWDSLLLPTFLFVWDSHKKRWCEFRIGDLSLSGATVAEFHDGKAYYPIPLKELPAEWTAHEPA